MFDLVILSQTATGLQNAINILNNFCDKRKLNVNLKKTKVVVFQKKQRKEQRYKFFLNTNVVDIVNEYTYLGISITSNGKFTDGVEILREKAKFAMGAFQKRFNLSRLPAGAYAAFSAGRCTLSLSGPHVSSP